MSALRLERFGPDVDATWGRLFLLGTPDVFFTVEPPWHFNRPFKSCIPAGVYDLMRHNSTKYPGSWAMVGDGVSHFKLAGVPRYACLIHVANWAPQLDGCVAPGTSIKWMNGDQAVANSKFSLDHIDKFLSNSTDPQIEIVSL